MAATSTTHNYVITRSPTRRGSARGGLRQQGRVFSPQGILSIRGQRRTRRLGLPRKPGFLKASPPLTLGRGKTKEFLLKKAGPDSSAPPYARAYERRQSARGGRSHEEEGGQLSRSNRCIFFLPPFLLLSSSTPLTGFLFTDRTKNGKRNTARRSTEGTPGNGKAPP